MDARRLLLPNEYVLRRVSAFNVVDRFPYGHFVPTPKDTDGLTVWRIPIKTPEDLVVGQSNKWGYYVCRFQVDELVKMGLAVTLTDEDLPGHCSIPETSWQAYQGDKIAVTEKLKSLAELAWNRRVLGPTQPTV